MLSHNVMPTTKKFGNPGQANKAIGGLPVMHYFDFASRGRGQVVRLMWEDAGIAYEDVRYTFEEYPEYKNSKIQRMNPNATIPVIELNGKILTQSYAILRHFARQLGKYDGQTEDEKYWADAMCDIALDCVYFFNLSMAYTHTSQGAPSSSKPSSAPTKMKPTPNTKKAIAPTSSRPWRPTSSPTSFQPAVRL